ncbi:hypothetical protein PLICRDRAFT_560578 [Plicaturopsis crispa FD-325 SS-3]|nr:hypothetical protein PLICRDRAFT_560578 [Plicaturopsis crispa FD-325 SS-3]
MAAADGLGTTWGVGFVAVIVSAMMYGGSCVQLYSYFELNVGDPKLFLWIAVALWGLDSLHQALLINSFYHYLIVNYGNPSALSTGVWSFLLTDVVQGINAVGVELFFVYRLWILGKRRNWALCSLIISTVSGHFAMQLIYGVKAMQRPAFADQQNLSTFNKPVIIAGVVLSCSTDLLIAGSLCYYLWTNRTGHRITDSIMNKIMLYSVSTGMLTSVFQLLDLIMFKAYPNTFYWTIFDFCVGKLYTISFLSSLNARDKHKRSLHSQRSQNSSSYAMRSGIGPVSPHAAYQNQVKSPNRPEFVLDVYPEDPSGNDFERRAYNSVEGYRHKHAMPLSA